MKTVKVILSFFVIALFAIEFAGSCEDSNNTSSSGTNSEETSLKEDTQPTLPTMFNVGKQSTYIAKFYNMEESWQKCEFILYADGTAIVNSTVMNLMDNSMREFTDDYATWEIQHFHESKHNVVEDFDYIYISCRNAYGREFLCILEDGTLCKYVVESPYKENPIGKVTKK